MAPSAFFDTYPLLNFDRPWTLEPSFAHPDPRVSVGHDARLLQRVIRGECGPCICIKRDPRCLVATVREAQMPDFDLACARMASRGWPVVVRSSGGGCVPQGQGVLNLSLIYPRVKGWQLEDGYLLLCDLLTRFLATYGLHAETGEVAGSFCDGRYNLQIDGRKLVGTAQRWAGSSRENAAILSHACLLVDLDLAEATSQINTLYRLCGNSRQFDPQACSTLRECLGNPLDGGSEVFFDEVTLRLISLVKEVFQIV